MLRVPALPRAPNTSHRADLCPRLLPILPFWDLPAPRWRPQTPGPHCARTARWHLPLLWAWRAGAGGVWGRTAGSGPRPPEPENPRQQRATRPLEPISLWRHPDSPMFPSRLSAYRAPGLFGIREGGCAAEGAGRGGVLGGGKEWGPESRGGGQKLQGQNEGGSVGPRAQGQDAQGLPCASVARPKPRAPSLWPPLPPCCPAEASTVAGSCRLAGPLPSSQNIPAPCVTGPSALSQKSQRGAEAPPGGGDHGRQWGLGSLCPGTAQGPFQSPC